MYLQRCLGTRLTTYELDTFRPPRTATTEPSISQSNQSQSTEEHQPLRTDAAQSGSPEATGPSNVIVQRNSNGRFVGTAKDNPASMPKDRSAIEATTNRLSGEKELRTRVQKPVMKSRSLTETTVNTSDLRSSERATGQQRATASSERG